MCSRDYMMLFYVHFFMVNFMSSLHRHQLHWFILLHQRRVVDIPRIDSKADVLLIVEG